MIKYVQLLTVLIILMASAASAENYVITINGTSHDLDLDQKTKVTLPDGTPLKLTLHMKEYLRFSGDMFTFEHKNHYKPGRTDLGSGVFQTMIVTSIGTGIIIQEYQNLNPTHLVDLILKELTKEEIEYGYKYKEKVFHKKVGKHVLAGKQAVTTYQGEEWTRSILSYGARDSGMLIITFIEKDNYDQEKEMLENFWASLEIK